MCLIGKPKSEIITPLLDLFYLMLNFNLLNAGRFYTDPNYAKRQKFNVFQFLLTMILAKIYKEQLRMLIYCCNYMTSRNFLRAKGPNLGKQLDQNIK